MTFNLRNVLFFQNLNRSITKIEKKNYAIAFWSEILHGSNIWSAFMQLHINKLRRKNYSNSCANCRHYGETRQICAWQPSWFFIDLRINVACRKITTAHTHTCIVYTHIRVLVGMHIQTKIQSTMNSTQAMTWKKCKGQAWYEMKMDKEVWECFFLFWKCSKTATSNANMN